MTYRELYEKALDDLEHNKITLGEFDERVKPLNQEARKTGHWIEHPKDIYAHLVCDKCLSNAPYDCQTNYCPNCGAKMEGE